MVYSIWKDISFYFYILLAISSAVVIVSSIRRLLEEGDNGIEISEDNFDISTDIQQEDSVNVKDTFTTSSDVPSSTTSQESVEEKIVFKKEETIFDTKTEKENDENKKDISTKNEEKALIFLKTLNENLVAIKDSVDKISIIENKVHEIDEKIKSFEYEIKEILRNEISDKLSQMDLTNLKLEGTSEKQMTPKYVSKYLEDILEDFDSLEKDVIRKRIKVIAEDLKKISGE